MSTVAVLTESVSAIAVLTESVSAVATAVAVVTESVSAVAVFTENELEKDPLKEVAAEPYELLDKTRYDFSSKQLAEEREVQLDSIMSKLREECTIKGIMVQPLLG